MKSHLHVLVVLAITDKIADANFHYTECDLTKLLQSVIWILTIRMNCKHTRVWTQDIFKKSTVLTKKYRENTLLGINSVIDDRLTSKISKVYNVHGLVVSIFPLLITMDLLI